MNEFEELCKLASTEKWCWNLGCTTCGHVHFRYAFAELAAGKSPTDPGWVIHAKKRQYEKRLGPFPRTYSDLVKEKVTKICIQADLSSIAFSCNFPDWLGYLGLVLSHMSSESDLYTLLSKTWAAQLSLLVPINSTIYHRLTLIADSKALLSLSDLESCENSMKKIFID